MKSILFTALCLTVSTPALSQTEPKKAAKNKNMATIKMVNKEDPICHMKTSEKWKDTLVLNKKTYGFCSAHCKEEFKRNPKKHLK